MGSKEKRTWGGDNVPSNVRSIGNVKLRSGKVKLTHHEIIDCIADQAVLVTIQMSK